MEPARLGRLRSRDPKGDPVLAAALADRARCLVVRDRRALALEKPFGVEVRTPAEFLHRIETER